MAKVESFLTREQVEALIEIGEKNDLLREAGGNEGVAELLGEVKGKYGVPLKRRP